MPDDTNPGPSNSDHAAAPVPGEPGTVVLKEPRDRAYWARRFEAPIERVQAAVEAVGDDPGRVAAHLGKPWPYEASGIV